MKKNFRILSVFLTIIISLVSINTSVFAYTDIDYNNKLTNGKNIAYWVSPTCEYTNAIPNAVNRMMYPTNMTNPNVLWKTQVNSDSKMDFYQVSAQDGVAAYTMSFKKNSVGDYYAMPLYEKKLYDWVYGEIYINDYYMVDYSPTKRALVVLHEMLHVYGCKDIDNIYSIMNYNASCFETIVNGITNDANDILNQKYNY